MPNFKLAHALRLSFHDCVGKIYHVQNHCTVFSSCTGTFVSTVGGCDGCINVNNPRNSGPMLDTLKLIDGLYDSKNFKASLTRADMYALSGVVAIEIGLKNANIGCTDNCLTMVTNNYLKHFQVKSLYISAKNRLFVLSPRLPNISIYVC